jgi:hypothetical protein
LPTPSSTSTALETDMAQLDVPPSFVVEISAIAVLPASA